VLRDVTDCSALSAEFDATMQEAFSDASPMISGSAGNEFHYVPMMSDRTPVSLGLVLRLSVLAAELLGGQVLPSRAKGRGTGPRRSGTAVRECRSGAWASRSAPRLRPMTSTPGGASWTLTASG